MVLHHTLGQGIQFCLQLGLPEQLLLLLILQVLSVHHHLFKLLALFELLLSGGDLGIEVLHSVFAPFHRARRSQLSRPVREIIAALKVEQNIVRRSQCANEIFGRQPSRIVNSLGQQHIIFGTVNHNPIPHGRSCVHVNEHLGTGPHPGNLPALIDYFVCSQMDMISVDFRQPLPFNEWPVNHVRTVHAVSQVTAVFQLLQQEIVFHHLHCVALVGSHHQGPITLLDHGVPLLFIEEDDRHQLLNTKLLEIAESHEVRHLNEPILPDSHINLMGGMAKNVGQLLGKFFYLGAGCSLLLFQSLVERLQHLTVPVELQVPSGPVILVPFVLVLLGSLLPCLLLRHIII
mmetsp:Transcript_9603/g.20851  ORF Transcript_9603/g.20851 Transcript_9603/m.20851 type:complete len:346 (+) Transcript_9603:1587-2624(+)